MKNKKLYLIKKREKALHEGYDLVSPVPKQEWKKHKTHTMTMKRHDRGGTMPCLHCSCGDTWGATERAMGFLIAEHNALRSYTMQIVGEVKKLEKKDTFAWGEIYNRGLSDAIEKIKRV